MVWQNCDADSTIDASELTTEQQKSFQTRLLRGKFINDKRKV